MSFGRIDRVFVVEAEAQAKGLMSIDGMRVIENTHVKIPLVEIGRGDERDAWGERLVDLLKFLVKDVSDSVQAGLRSRVDRPCRDALL